MSDAITEADAIAAVRRFSRFYTRQLGLLDEGLLKSDFSLTEARVLYELAQRATSTASCLCDDLRLDAGYLSRILKVFEQRGFIIRRASPDDGRQTLIALTAAGRAVFDPLDRASRNDVRSMISPLSAEDMGRLVGAMRTIERLIGGESALAVPYFLRPLRLGDIGWITYRQGILYAEQYGWDESYEALVAEILAGMMKAFDPQRECGWIAERDGEVIGSVFVVRSSDTLAKLRLLYVEPSARGLGIGRRLVDECVRFAREKGYTTLTLWANDVLLSARRIYQAAGFSCVAAEPHHSFGKDLIGETWELRL